MSIDVFRITARDRTARSAARRRFIARLAAIPVALALLTAHAFAQGGNVTLSGIITDAETGDILPGASVLLYPPAADPADTTEPSGMPLRGAAANSYGFYSIPNVEPGTYTLVIRSIGNASHVRRVTLSPTAPSRFDVALGASSLATDVVTVTAGRESEPETRRISTVDLPVEVLAKLPALGGESDILRTLQLLPGVQQATEISSGLYVRGGSPDQNLTLLDEVIIYNPSHLAGFLSTFNSDAIRDVRLIKGAFPAKYGGRLSSVLDLTMREGTKKKISGAGGVSLISSRLTVEGPISEESTFMISGRRFYLDILKNLATSPEDDVPDYYFYDLNGKVNYSLGPSDRLFASGYTGRDIVSFDEGDDQFDVRWGNTTGNVRWAHILSPSLFTNFSLGYTSYSFESSFRDRSFDSSSVDVFAAVTGIGDLRFRGDMQWYPHQDHVVQMGTEGTWHRFETKLLDETFENIDIEIPDTIGRQRVQAFEAAVYMQDEWQATDRLALNIGGRVAWFQRGDHVYAEPRFSAAYTIRPELTLTGAVALAHQPVHLVLRNDIALPTDSWFPATDVIKPGEAWQSSIGVQGLLDGGTFGYSVEAYYKSMRHLYEFKDSASFTFLTVPETQLTEGTGKAYGIEFFLEKKLGAVTGWLGYSLAKTERQFADLNQGKPYPPRYDRRHDAKAVVMYRLGESWEFGAAWVYGTGQAHTVPTGSYGFTDSDVERGFDENDPYIITGKRYTERNAYRLPAYHRLDVNFSHTFSWFDLPFRLSLNVYNVYNRRNVFAWYIDGEYDPETNELKQVVKQLTLFPIIPTVGLSFSF